MPKRETRLPVRSGSWPRFDAESSFLSKLAFAEDLGNADVARRKDVHVVHDSVGLTHGYVSFYVTDEAEPAICTFRLTILTMLQNADLVGR